MPLCKLCSSISFFSLPAFPDWVGQYYPVFGLVVYKDRKSANGRQLGIAHYPNRESLVASADTCALCRLIETTLSETLKAYETLEAGQLRKTLKDIGPPAGQLWICRRPNSFDGFVVLSPGELKDYYMVAAAGFCVEEDSSLAQKFGGRRVDPNPLSQTTLNRVHKWVNDCENGHGHQNLTHVELPTRLIDVSDPSLSETQVRLAEFNGDYGCYLSLSHCWGTSRGITTTKRTMARRKAGINMTDLPKTFQDAVRLTRELGQRYIWIDSLCICQDDKQDWERESAKMAALYSKAYINIAASAASEDIAGFLNARPIRTYVPLTFSGQGYPKGTVYAFAIPFAEDATNGYEYVNMSKEPLVTRGWTLQERFLAPRTIHYGSTQLSFECLTHFTTEDGYVHPKPMDYLGASSTRTISNKWHEIISAYSKRRLTKDTDKLPAVAGLARAFEDRCTRSSAKQQYLAGLWRDNLLQYLCWTSSGSKNERALEYRAPSWSWACLDGGISSLTLSDWEEIAVIEDAGVELAGENPYGWVKSGWVRLRAPRMRVTRKPGDEKMAMLLVEGQERRGFMVVWDCWTEMEGKGVDAMDLYAIGMVYVKSSISQTVALLVSEKQKDGRSVFERAGAVSVQNEYVSEELKRRWKEGRIETMTLV